MYEQLFRHLSESIALSSAEKAYCRKVFMPVSFSRKTIVQEPGKSCRYLFYVCEGCLRTYTVDEKGIEHTVQFAPEEWWISEMYSFLTGSPGTYFIEALEDTRVLALESTEWDSLFAQIPAFERFFRLQLQRNYIATHRRLAEAMTLSAAEKYKRFRQTHPGLSARLPVKMIASFLGMSPETLSRLRRLAD